MKKTIKPYNSDKAFVIGRDSFAKISAVEGIDLEGDIRKELEEFDRLGLSQDARRELVRQRFSKKPA